MALPKKIQYREKLQISFLSMASESTKNCCPEQPELKQVRGESQERLGKKIRQIRRSRNMSQLSIAARMGVTPAALSKWERGLSDLRVTDAIRLCSILQESPTALCDRPKSGNFFPESSIGQRVQFARSAAGLKQDVLGRMVGVRRSTISKWENGLMIPRISEICEIAVACNCAVNFLIFGGGTKE